MTQTLTAAHALMDISTHTLTWSVTLRKKLNHYYHLNFNSHAHVERDEDFDFTLNRLKDFNSHAHVERDEIAFYFLLTHSIFQLTRSRGA